MPAFLHANISTVGYVHDTILSSKGIDIPVDSGVNRSQPHSVKYLMKQIDAANEMLGKNTSYAVSAATNLVEKTKVTNDIDNLIQIPQVKLSFKDINNSNPLTFDISAKGIWKIDWGDGNVEDVIKTDTDDLQISHQYTNSQNMDFIITMSGRATAYNTNTRIPAISFNGSSLSKIEGSLVSVFPTINNINPSFAGAFYNTYELKNISNDLFAGLSGPPVPYMFESTFEFSAIKSIPDGLFASLTGAPAEGMFKDTFYETSGVEYVPENLFASISGVPAKNMFWNTFSLSNIKAIPENLFASIVGAPAEGMFAGTFSFCYGLSGAIPSGLFAGISGAPAVSMFSGTFLVCSGLTSLPPGLFAGISGAPAISMFADTFSSCSGLTGSIPTGFFGKFNGPAAYSAFWGTFSGCSGLTTIEDGIWDLSEVENTPSTYMFSSCFAYCINITSETPSIKAGSNVKLWQHFTSSSSNYCFADCENMIDINNVPDRWLYD